MARYVDAHLAPIYLNSIACEQIKRMPTADVVEVKHGEWKWDERFSDYTCSLCHNWDLTTPNYCPHCGAKMDGDYV